MKFQILSSNWCLNSEIDKLHEHYPILDNFGFEVTEFREPYRIPIRDENGKRMFQEAYRTKQKAFINIDSLEQLMAFIKAVDCEIIIFNHEPAIEIYDGYRE